MSEKLGKVLGIYHGPPTGYHDNPLVLESRDLLMQHMYGLKPGDTVVVESKYGIFNDIINAYRGSGIKVFVLENKHLVRKGYAYGSAANLLAQENDQGRIGNEVSEPVKNALKKISAETRIDVNKLEVIPALRRFLVLNELRSNRFLRAIKKLKPALVILGDKHVSDLQKYLPEYNIYRSPSAIQVTAHHDRVHERLFPELVNKIKAMRTKRFKK